MCLAYHVILFSTDCSWNILSACWPAGFGGFAVWFFNASSVETCAGEWAWGTVALGPWPGSLVNEIGLVWI